LLLDAPASVKAAPLVAKLLAVEMGKDQKWQEEQVKEYEGLARGYIVA
jgi:glycerol-3-phosphate dehydrogenase